MGKLSGVELKRARLVPSSVFASPQEVLRSLELSRAQKIAILRRWEFDARPTTAEPAARQDATDSGAGPRGPARLGRSATRCGARQHDPSLITRRRRSAAHVRAVGRGSARCAMPGNRGQRGRGPSCVLEGWRPLNSALRAGIGWSSLRGCPKAGGPGRLLYLPPRGPDLNRSGRPSSPSSRPCWGSRPEASTCSGTPSAGFSTSSRPPNTPIDLAQAGYAQPRRRSSSSSLRPRTGGDRQRQRPPRVRATAARAARANRRRAGTPEQRAQRRRCLPR